MGKGGFSWKRAIGVTRAKGAVSRKTGIPLTKSGRQRKVGKALTGDGCIVAFMAIGLALAAGAVILRIAC
jgi:hypothetical protein